MAAMTFSIRWLERGKRRQGRNIAGGAECGAERRPRNEDHGKKKRKEITKRNNEKKKRKEEQPSQLAQDRGGSRCAVELFWRSCLCWARSGSTRQAPKPKPHSRRSGLPFPPASK